MFSPNYQCKVGAGDSRPDDAPPGRWLRGCSAIKPLLRHEQQVRKLWQRKLEQVVMPEEDKAMKWLAVLE